MKKIPEEKLEWMRVDFPSLVPLVLALSYGSRKYRDSVENLNYRKKKHSRTKILSSILRHVLELASGNEIDPESGLPIIGHIMARCMMYSFHFTDKKFKNMYMRADLGRRTGKRKAFNRRKVRKKQ